MAQAVKMYLLVNGKEVDLTEAGIINASFDRYMNPNNVRSGILSQMDLVLFDTKGSNLLPQLTGPTANSITFKYGFIDEDSPTRDRYMSPWYKLDIIKAKSRWTNGGATLSLGAVGQQIQVSTQARIYLKGTSIRDIIFDIAEAQGWDTTYVHEDSLKNLVLLNDTIKEAGEDDFAFLEQKIKPLCYTSGLVSGLVFESWVVRLFKIGTITHLHFAPVSKKIKETVWVYDIGVTPNSQVLEFTSEVDLSYLIKGLNLVVYSSDVDLLVGPDRDQEQIVQETVKKATECARKILSDYHIPIELPDNITFNVTLKYSEDADGLTLEQRILAALDRAIQNVAKVELTVVGNPHIMPNDLVLLNAKYNDGVSQLITAAGGSSYWRIVQITENVSLGNYTTSLVLAREIIDTRR